MIDIHSHILPGVDDGAQTIDDSLAMARAAVDEGITKIVATPHHRNGVYDNEGADILKYVEILNNVLKEEMVPLTVMPGQETRLHGQIIEELQTGVMLPINDSKYVFFEFPADSVPRYASQMLFDIQVAGYVPIIVHPERNQELIENPDRLYDFVKKGALTQLTAASVIVLDMGEPVKIVDLAKNLIKLSGYTEDEIPITYTGLRPGEKMYEELLGEDEILPGEVYEKIYVGRTIEVDSELIDCLIDNFRECDEKELKNRLMEIVYMEREQMAVQA